MNHPSGGSSPMQSKTFWPTWALLLGLSGTSDLTEEIIKASPAMFTMDLSFVDKASFGVAAREMHTLLAQKDGATSRMRD